MSLADLRRKSSSTLLSNIIDKTKNLSKPKTMVKKANSAYDKLKLICEQVEARLGKYREDFECIQDINRLNEYIQTAIKNGAIAIDTETTGLDPFTDEIVGVCIYTPNEKAAYVPINHISMITNLRLNDQLTNNQVKDAFQLLKDNDVKIIYFNAKFDIRVMRHQLGIDLPPSWDGFIAGKVLKENELEGNLKYLWKKYCGKDKDEAHFTFDKMFSGYKFNIIPIKTAYLYAAKDALMTWELYKFQEPYLTKTDQKCIDCDFTRLADLYHNIELPIISFVADIEDNGIGLDIDYCKKLSVKYHKLLDEKLTNFNLALKNYENDIMNYKASHPNTKLEDPINISSPTQLAELFYDVLKLDAVSKKQPRGTGEEILEKLNHPLCKPILEYRGVNKLLTTYIDKMPQVVNKKTGRIHCNFLQVGTDTGRFASKEPNLQNIPSHNSDIRPMFIASPGNVLIGSDFSQQEPKLTADLSNDEEFIKNCASGRDAYAIIASIAFEKPYEECLEFYLDENGNKTSKINKEGKERRSMAKVILLGICYGKSMKSIAVDMNVPIEKAQEIYDAVMRNIPGLKRFMDESQEMAAKYGFVETKWGRRRHIPDMQLQPYEINCKGTINFDPFFDSEELGVISDIDRLKQQYLQEIQNAKYYKQKQQIKERAKKDGFEIKDNNGFIEDAKRQCVNSRVQGSAADQTKIAMQNIYKNERLKELGWKTLLLVHDEIIGQCPIENAKECAKIFSQCMIDSAKDLRTGAKCDTNYTFCWYGDEIDLDNLTLEEVEKLYQEYLRKRKEE